MAQSKRKDKKSEAIAAHVIQRAVVSPAALGYMRELLECIPPDRLKKELLDVFLIFLEYEYENLPLNFRETVRDYHLLFYFLDKIEEEMKGGD